jgi:hypothetical protein
LRKRIRSAGSRPVWASCLAETFGDAGGEKLTFPQLAEDQEAIDLFRTPRTLIELVAIQLGVEEGRQRFEGAMGRDGGLEPLGVAWTGVGEIAEGGDVGPGGIRIPRPPEDLDELQTEVELPGILRQFRLDEGAGGDHEIPLEEEGGEVEDVLRFGLLGLEPAHHLPDGTRLPGRDADLGEFAGDIEPGRMIAHIPLEVGRGGIEPLDPAEVALQFEDAGGSFGGLESGDDGFEILLGGGIATEGILDFDEPETQVEARRVGFEPIGEKAGVGLEIGRALEPLEGPRLDEAGLREPVKAVVSTVTASLRRSTATRASA